MERGKERENNADLHFRSISLFPSFVFDSNLQCVFILTATSSEGYSENFQWVNLTKNYCTAQNKENDYKFH